MLRASLSKASGYETYSLGTVSDNSYFRVSFAKLRLNCVLFQATPDAFWEDFLHHLKYSLVIFKQEPAVERTLEFVARFVTSTIAPPGDKAANGCHSDEEDAQELPPILIKLFDYLLKVSTCSKVCPGSIIQAKITSTIQVLVSARVPYYAPIPCHINAPTPSLPGHICPPPVKQSQYRVYCHGFTTYHTILYS